MKEVKREVCGMDARFQDWTILIQAECFLFDKNLCAYFFRYIYTSTVINDHKEIKIDNQYSIKT